MRGDVILSDDAAAGLRPLLRGLHRSDALARPQAVASRIPGSVNCGAPTAARLHQRQYMTRQILERLGGNWRSFLALVATLMPLPKINRALISLLFVCAGACSERPAQSAGSLPEASSLAGLDEGLTGVWVGTATGPVDSVGRRFEITDNNGQLTGVTFYLEPSSSEYIKMGTLSGSRTGATVQWTSGNNSVAGTLSGDAFSGTLVFGSDGIDPEVTAQISLQRSSCVSETDASFCSHIGFDCGLAIGADNCNVRRRVPSCGTCGAGLSCNALNTCQ